MLLEPLTPEQEEALFEEIRYSKERLEKDLQDLKDWLKRQHHLPPSRLKEKDGFLKMFLTGCKGNLDKTKKKLDGYYTIRSHSEFFATRDPLEPEYSIAKTYFYFGAGPRIAKDKLVRVTLLALASPDPSKCDMLMYVRKMLNFCELRLRTDEYSIRDFIVVDCKGCSFRHILKAKPLLLRDVARIAEDVLPLRYMTAFAINAPSYIEVTVNTLIKPFISKKLSKRIIITSNGCEELYKYIDKSSLMTELGGDNGNIREISENWHKKELELRDYFINEISERTDESKRISKQDTMKNPFLNFPRLKQFVID